ncbi:MAG: adenylate/guanylate cyclase domain-containing protein [Rhizobiales bacterium]|nr:adenylate/guanylate cyclase domain-containing protein [Hyphomicrobiales bacterium]
MIASPAATPRLFPRKLRPGSAWVAAAGFLCLIVAALLAWLDPGSLLRSLREGSFDRMLAMAPRGDAGSTVVIVDIGRDALAEIGPWPWPRAQLAALVNRIADGGPQALAIDILLAPRESEPDDGGLAAALARVPAVLGIVLDPAPTAPAPFASAIAVSGNVEVPGLLQTPGASLPDPALLGMAAGAGVISLPAPEGEPVRAVPLLAGGAGALFPGFAVEAIRVAQGGANLIASSPPQVLRIGEVALPLPPDGLMRLHFASAADVALRTIPAQDVLAGRADAARITGKIVLLGASAPEAGGLRLTAVDPLMPSVDIQAEAISQMLAGDIPWRAQFMTRAEILVGVALGLIGILAVLMLPPGRAALAWLSLAIAWILCAIFFSLSRMWLTDPIIPVLLLLIGTQGAALAQFALTYRQRLAIERRFALHMPPEVVQRIIDRPGELRLGGETRTITVLFTDIEDFTALTERVGAEAVVSLLDRYVDLVAGIIVAHGGMVDKIVGDAVHGFFNAPLDLPDHAGKAVACGLAIIQATEAFRRAPGVAGLGLGRTRIGIETGPAILGEVGRGARRDYTAYGRPLNLASRLQTANKTFGSSIALGPGTVAALDGSVPLKRLGALNLRGIGDEVEVYTPE